jgi:hypothetical protein
MASELILPIALAVRTHPLGVPVAVWFDHRDRPPPDASRRPRPRFLGGRGNLGYPKGVFWV